MPIRLDHRNPDFAERFASFLAMKREVSRDIDAAARAIVEDVAARGDAALIEAPAKYDRQTLNATTLRITADEIAAATAACDPKTVDAMKLARDRIETYHRRQLPEVVCF